MPKPKARFAIAGFLYCATAMPPIAAQAHECAEITEHKARLTCQTQKRRSYGTGLERALSERESDLRVFVEETGEPGSGAYPRLIIWTFLTKDKVYELNADANILEDARKAGFRMIVYVDKGEDSNWYFNLTRPGRVALDVVPWQSPPWTRKN